MSCSRKFIKRGSLYCAVGRFSVIITNINCLQSAPICTGELTFMDVDTGEAVTLRGTDLTIEFNVITLTVHQNHHYNTTVIASNIAGSATSWTRISKILLIYQGG